MWLVFKDVVICSTPFLSTTFLGSLSTALWICYFSCGLLVVDREICCFCCWSGSLGCSLLPNSWVLWPFCESCCVGFPLQLLWIATSRITPQSLRFFSLLRCTFVVTFCNFLPYCIWCYHLCFGHTRLLYCTLKKLSIVVYVDDRHLLNRDGVLPPQTLLLEAFLLNASLFNHQRASAPKLFVPHLKPPSYGLSFLPAQHGLSPAWICRF